MNELLKQLLLSMNCTIINPMAASITNKTTVGWYCKSTSLLRKSTHLEIIQQHITENKLPSDSEQTINFFIYITKN
jgi:hypothetical protein